jgi:hypothetical protein
MIRLNNKNTILSKNESIVQRNRDNIVRKISTTKNRLQPGSGRNCIFRNILDIHDK